MDPKRLVLALCPAPLARHGCSVPAAPLKLLSNPPPQGITTNDMDLLLALTTGIPSFFGGMGTLFGLSRRRNQVGVVSFQLKLVSGIALSGIFSGIGGVFWTVSSFFVPVQGLFVSTATQLSLGVGMVVTKTLLHPVRHSDRLRRGENPFPQQTAAMVAWWVVVCALRMVYYFTGMEDAYLVLIALRVVEGTTIVAILGYCVWKLVQRGIVLDTAAEAQIRLILLMVFFLAFTSGDGGFGLLILFFTNVCSPPTFTWYVLSLSNIVVSFSPAVWCAFIWIPYLMQPKNVKESTVALGRSSVIDGVYSDHFLASTTSDMIDGVESSMVWLQPVDSLYESSKCSEGRAFDGSVHF
jgi:hypothetical protein